jgi:ABC-type branched-subunit amino acid transport system substrate-binding protein
MALLGVVLAACTPALDIARLPAAEPGTLRIVSSLPSKGIYRRSTAETRQAIDLALGSRPGAASVRFEHVALEGGSDENGEWTTAVEERNARAAAGDPSVVAYIGPHNSGATGAALPITGRAGLLTGGVAATWPGLTQAGWERGQPEKFYPSGVRHFVRLVPPDSVQAEAAAEWAEADGRTNVIVMQDGSTYSEAMARELGRHLSGRASGPVLVPATGERVIMPDLVGYDAVFVAPSSVQSAGRLAIALAESGLPVYTTDVALDPQFLELAGGAVEGWHIVGNAGDPTTPIIAQLFPDTPEHLARNRTALSAYVMARLVAEAVDAGHMDRTGVLDYVRGKRLRDGTPLFDEAGDPTVWAAAGYRASGGSFQAVREFVR